MDVNLTTLDNGLRIITVERLQTETVSVGIWTNTGSAYETDKINGISHFIEHMVFKGTKKRTALQISEDIENVGGFSPDAMQLLEGDALSVEDIALDLSNLQSA